MDSRSTTKPRRLRAKLILKGHSYQSFAEQHGFNARTVKAAVRGERSGKVSQAIAQKILAL